MRSHLPHQYHNPGWTGGIEAVGFRLEQNVALNRHATDKPHIGRRGIPINNLRILGTSLGKYALSVRLREAKRLMMEERFSVKEVAAKMGFSSQAYFCYAYHAHFGHPPSSCHRSDNVKRITDL